MINADKKTLISVVRSVTNLFESEEVPTGKISLASWE